MTLTLDKLKKSVDAAHAAARHPETVKVVCKHEYRNNAVVGETAIGFMPTGSSLDNTGQAFFIHD